MEKSLVVLGVLSAFTSETFLHAAHQSELYAEVTDTILPGSNEVQKKLGILGTEKEYAVITFTKRKSDDAPLSTISFKWEGARIENLSASLFRKTSDHKPVQAVEENLIAEGKWNSAQQTLSFSFKEIELHGTNYFSLVILVTPKLEELLPKGTFSIIYDSLPRAFQRQESGKYLALAHR